ncbi:MAG: hypothetical protein K8S14_03545 [Actinomycetia bacterium]|nr:hypothetical protein [Actinomycetes bacterium]
MDDIKTFGNLLGFSIKLEDSLMNFYNKASEDSRFLNIAEDLSILIKQNIKRKSILERIRRENINEMILQPIEGLKPDSSLINIETGEMGRSPDILERAVKLEENSSKFYIDASYKAKLVLAEASRYFIKLAKENDIRSSRLKSIYSKLREE